MFDPYKAFTPLHNTTYPDLRTLLRALGQVRWMHLTELPVDFSVRELMDLARDRRWLTEDAEGMLRIHLDPEPQRRESTSTPSRKPARSPRAKKTLTDA